MPLIDPNDKEPDGNPELNDPFFERELEAVRLDGEICITDLEYASNGSSRIGFYVPLIEIAVKAYINQQRLKVEPLEQQNRDAFLELARQVAEEGDSYPFDDAITEAEFLDYWFAKGEIRVAVDGERVVGGYLIKPNQPWRGSHVANVGYVVDRALRGRGIGRVLVRDSIARARELGYRGIQFNLVVETNVGAVRLYESEGFVLVGTVPGIFRVKDGRYVDAHVMHLDLTGGDRDGANV